MYKVVKLRLETSHERLLIANCVHLWADPETILTGGGGGGGGSAMEQYLPQNSSGV